MRTGTTPAASLPRAAVAPPAPMPAGSRGRQVAGTRAGGTQANRIGAVFLLSLLWLLFELGRPPTPAGLPLLITAILFLEWLPKQEKQLGPHWIWWLVLLGVVASGVAFAPNTYAAYFNARLLGTIVIGVCLPMQALFTSLRRVRWWIYAFIVVAFYVGAWATTHGGYGPAGGAGQDENYVAALMTMGIAMAYFSIFTDKRLLFRLLLIGAMLAYVAAMAVAQNPSRGGFLALLAVALYCLWRSPRRLAGMTVLGVAGLALVVAAGDRFWNEIRTTTDYSSGTGDMRLELWKAGLEMWKSNPLLGVGSGNYRWVLGEFQSHAQFEKFGRELAGSVIAHSSHVEMLSELGSLGALAMIVLTWSTWKGLGAIRPARPKAGMPPVHPDLVQLGHFADALRCAILAVLVNGLFLSLFYYSHLWVLLAVGTALPYVHRRILQREAAVMAPATGSAAPVIQINAHASHGRRRVPTRRRG